MRKSKQITDKDELNEIINLTQEEASTKELIMRYFGDFGNGSKYNPYDIIEIPPSTYGNKNKNKNKFTTTVGLWIFNKSFLEKFSDVIGYINSTVDADAYEDINQKLSYALLENKIELEDFKKFIVQSQIIMSCASAICPSHTNAIFDLNKKVSKKKKELENKYSEGIKNKDLVEIKKMENELLDYAKSEIKDDECADMFDSGARSSYGNNFKNMYVSRGPIKHTDGSYDVVLTSYMDGLESKDLANVNDAAVGGPYSRAINTSAGGYKEKIFLNATQHLKVDKPGTDCGSDKYITVELTKKNIKDWMYCFIKEGNKLVELTSDNTDKYINKTVKIRFSAFCKSKKDGYICEKCMGSLYNRIGITNVGLGSMIMMSSLKNASMKAFHDSTLSLFDIDVDSVF